MTTPWRPRIDPVADGERVDAVVSGRPISQLSSQTAHLKERVESLSNTSGRLVYMNAPLHFSTLKGDFVYYNSGEECFAPALAEIVQDGISGKMLCGERALAIGMVLTKESPTSGSIIQLGRVNLEDAGIDPNDLSQDPVNEPFLAGRLFLSNKVPGKTTRSPVMPSIQLGFFSEGECHINILQKDLFESHQHHRYELRAKPSASQNFAQTGWTSFGLSGPSDLKRVDYYNSGVDVDPVEILMCVRHSANAAIPEDDPVRVEIYNDGGDFMVDLVSGGIDFNDPSSAGSTTVALPAASWPEYGEWVAIAGTNLEVAFIRSDATYSNSLQDDADSLLDVTTKRFLVYLPDDLGGWTNANPFDLTCPQGAVYRYLTGQDPLLLSVFPPLPVSSAIIELNGSSMVPGEDFEVTISGIFWRLGNLTPLDVAPWPSDYSTDGVTEPDSSNAKHLVLHFIKSGLDGLNSIVFSLKGISPIKVTRCPGGEEADAGHLQVSIDLGLLMSQDLINSESGISAVSGISFQRAFVVSEIVEGAGIRVENITDDATYGARGVGKVRVSARDARFEGEFSSIALRNAKEMIIPSGTFIDFILPSLGASGITAQFKIPNEDVNLEQFKLKIFGAFRGDTAVPNASAEQFAIMKATYHVARPGFNMNSMNASNAVAIQYWRIPFAPGYQAGTILSPELPYDADDEDAFEINSQTLIDNPSSLVALDDGFKAGDRFVILLDRVAEDGDSNDASYPGRVGLVGLRWAIS